MSERDSDEKTTRPAAPKGTASAATHNNKKRNKISFATSLPCTGIHILLVGASHFCEVLGSSLLQVGDHNKRRRRQKRDYTKDAAIEALRSIINQDEEEMNGIHKRNIQMVESLGQVTSESTKLRRTNHIVLVVSPSNIETSKQLLEDSLQYLNKDYILMERVSIVIMDGSQEVRNGQWELFMRSTTKKFTKFACESQNKNSCLAVARMLLKRATAAGRMGPLSVSPLLLL